jgi:hypothetical protein
VGALPDCTFKKFVLWIALRDLSLTECLFVTVAMTKSSGWFL